MENSTQTRNEIDLNIGGMTCASCVARVEGSLKKVPGVIDARVNLATEKARVTVGSVKPVYEEIIHAVENAGYKAQVVESEPHNHRLHQEEKNFSLKEQQRQVLMAALLSLPLILPMLLQPFGIEIQLPAWLQWALATPVQFWLGRKFYGTGWKALKNLSGNMDLLVAIGTTAAYGLSLYLWFFSHEGHSSPHLYFEGSAVIITLVLLGKYLEARAKQQATSAILSLQSLRPEKARVRIGVREREVPVSELRVGHLIVVRPGERIPADGVVIEGQSLADESLVTGESIPVDKTMNDKVIGGSLNANGVLVIKATAVGAESVLNRIVRMVENAQTAKAPVEKMADRVSAVFVPAILFISLVTILGWGFYSGNWEAAVINGVAVLVIACPCALGLATPAAVMVGTGVAARAGILIQDAAALEIAHSVTTVVFDKTGTLTEGRPQVVSIQSAGVHGVLGSAVDGKKEILKLMVALQKGSEHPLARAVLQKAEVEGLLSVDAATKMRTLPGRGLQGEVNGQVILIGTERLLQERSIDLGEFKNESQAAATAGEAVSFIANDSTKKILGSVRFMDRAKGTSAAAISKLQLLGIKTMMLTGDSEGSAEKIAQQLGIYQFKARVLPEEKAQVIQQLKKQGERVAMVGDGINDAPALAAADVGVAFSTGTDVAMQTAGITLMHGNPLLVADAIEISKKTFTKIRQNLFWAFIYNIVGIPLAALGYLNPMVAGAAMAFSSVSVIANALLLRNWKPQSQKGKPA